MEGSDPEMSQQTQMLTVIYWAFTTLSTVGFGDLSARSEFERVVCAFVFLFGVSVFSYILGILMGILSEITLFNADIGDGDGLAAFFKLMQRFNNDRPINNRL